MKFFGNGVCVYVVPDVVWSAKRSKVVRFDGNIFNNTVMDASYSSLPPMKYQRCKHFHSLVFMFGGENRE